MKQLAAAAWAWICAHPSDLIQVIVGLIASIAALSIYNATQSGKPASLLARAVDRIAARTRADAANKGWSIPVLGRSVFEEIQSMKAEAEAKAKADAERAAHTPSRAPSPATGTEPTGAPSGVRSSEPGFATVGVLRSITAVIAIVACVVGPVLSLASCAGTAPPILSPVLPHVVHRAEWGTCIEGGGKFELPNTGIVAMLTSACFAPMDAGAPDAAIAADASLDAEPEPVIPDKIQDAGASE